MVTIVAQELANPGQQHACIKMERLPVHFRPGMDTLYYPKPLSDCAIPGGAASMHEATTAAGKL